MSSFKIIPTTYQEDSEETRKENVFKIKYERMYHEDYVQSLIKLVEDLSVTSQAAIRDSKNRGTQRCAIPLIRRGYDAVQKFKEAKNE